MLLGSDLSRFMGSERSLLGIGADALPPWNLEPPGSLGHQPG